YSTRFYIDEVQVHVKTQQFDVLRIRRVELEDGSERVPWKQPKGWRRIPYSIGARRARRQFRREAERRESLDAGDAARESYAQRNETSGEESGSSSSSAL